MTVLPVDELAELVDVLDRVLQRRLPGGKECYGKEDPCETGEQHATCWAPRRSGDKTRRSDHP
jgi:hypothetical protein